MITIKYCIGGIVFYFLYWLWMFCFSSARVIDSSYTAAFVVLVLHFWLKRMAPNPFQAPGVTNGRCFCSDCEEFVALVGCPFAHVFGSLAGCADTSDGLCLLSHWHVFPLWYVSTGHARSYRIKQAWGTKLYSYASPHSPSHLRSFTNSRVVTVTISMTWMTTTKIRVHALTP